MSNVYFVQPQDGADGREIARRLAGYLAQGGETVNHYAIAGGALLGLVSHDRFSKGVMPRYLREQRLWGILAGELHDSDTLRDWRRAHPECGDDLDILAAMCREGRLAGYLPALNGAFFVVLWDPEARTLVAANDRYALYPMYWAERGAAFCLASRAAGPALAGVVEGRFDAVGAAFALTVDDFVGSATLVNGVSAFPRATILTRRAGDCAWAPYWEYDYRYEEPPAGIDELGEEAGRLLVRAVERQTGGRGRVGITLSGGLDSRCLAAAAAGLGIAAETFTWGREGCFDRQYAKRTAATLGLRHHDCDYEFMNITKEFARGVRATDGMCNLSDMHMLLHLHRLEGLDLVLNGYAGDAFLGGTFLRKEWMECAPGTDLAALVFAKRNTLLRESELSGALPGFAERAEDALPSAEYRRRFEPLAHLAAPDAVHRFIMENRQWRSTSLGTVLLRLTTESAACFFDYDLADLTLRIPAPMRYKHRVYLAMLRRTFPEVSRVPWQATMLPPGAPEWMVFCAKAARRVSRMVEQRTGWRGLSSRTPPADYAAWFRGPLRKWMEERVMEPNGAASEAISDAFCRRVWGEHLEGLDRTRLLGRIVTLRAFAAALADARRGGAAVSAEPVEVRA